mmetsp:Transcript_19647/g.32297  ORF Transcript_19647/g.32297 Transcript_19647/m.32297 type:complete len:612 (-) Transcript_19647:124-1959(-)|eukprot:CAMPEP_0203763264 /NCGR_PEP_ID=MMETSP0098-20131031/15939_1 /ASSEMBLY_ACC=CAM_ASM_000208 /TAXON_ID=96639 /ORGANISM=" , Strain NY0313808BC1" /LENGTH=611 /DNA_ID=CAMNT_0050657923 /DNA_START=913 /DNA_END=2748 /DNA_ORIENTATION=-
MGSYWSGCQKRKDACLTEERKSTVWFKILNAFFCLCAVCFFLYFFLVGLDLLGNAFKILAGDSAGSMFSIVSNPIAGLIVGIMATVLVQSSSTTTSIIVAAVGSGVLSVQAAIPMVFGANIGTSVTNTIVSIGFAGDRENYRRAFAGATVHDMFNYMNVCFWLPVELITNAINGGNGGVLFLLSEACASGFSACEGPDCEKWVGPLKVITGGLTSKVIKVNKDVIKDFSFGRPAADMCDLLCSTKKCVYKFAQKRCSKYLTAEPSTICGNIYKNETVSKKAKAKFVFCSEIDGGFAINETVLHDAQAHYDSYELNKAGVFYPMQKSAGAITLVLSIIILIICLVGLVKILSYIIRGSAEKIVKRALNMNGYLAILVGCGVTVFVQSSSITTSILTPLVAVGVLELEKMFPLTLGANIGTTFTGILASLVGSSQLGFQIAMVHFWFNVFGVIMFYPIPRVRQIPINAARKLGSCAARFRPFPLVYIIMMFFIYPGFLLLISIGYETGKAGAIAGCTVALVFVIALHVAIILWYKKLGGREHVEAWIQRKNFYFAEDTKNTDTGSNGSSADEDDGDLEGGEKKDGKPQPVPAISMRDVTEEETPSRDATIAIM